MRSLKCTVSMLRSSVIAVVTVLCVSSAHAYTETYEAGWQEARIQAVRKARDVMNKGREKKRLAALDGIEAEVEHNPRKRMRRKRK
ncbi:MAG: hypothetical protein R3312_02290 [Gammaproteobacteria bacterium]|nr:hypothetical protein [Gammaproteobacteria bacterium]